MTTEPSVAARAAFARALLVVQAGLIGLALLVGALAVVVQPLRVVWLAVAAAGFAVAVWFVVGGAVLALWGAAGLWPRRGPSPVLRAVRRFQRSLRGWRLALEIVVMVLGLTLIGLDPVERSAWGPSAAVSGAYGMVVVVCLTGIVVSAACVVPGDAPEKTPE